MPIKPLKKLIANRSTINDISATDYNRAMRYIEGLMNSLMANGFVDSNGIYARKPAKEISHKVFMARTTEAAGADADITANLCDSQGNEITSGFGSEITINCKICGGSALNSAIPRLADDDYIFVTNINGTWYCTTVFQTSEDCSCS